MANITNYEELKAAVAEMSKEDLELLARNVFLSLYGEVHLTDDCGTSDWTLDPDKQWDAGTVSDVADDLYMAGLKMTSPEEIDG